MNEKTNKLEARIINLEAEVNGLKHDLDYQLEKSKSASQQLSILRELQEEVAKLAGQPVGMMFTYLA